MISTPGFQFRDMAQQPEKVAQLVANQAGVAAPTTTNTLCNTTGTTLTWARTGAGVYTLTAGIATFTAGLTFPYLTINGTGLVGQAVVTSTTVVTINIFDAAGAAADLVGNMFFAVEVWS